MASPSRLPASSVAGPSNQGPGRENNVRTPGGNIPKAGHEAAEAAPKPQSHRDGNGQDTHPLVNDGSSSSEAPGTPPRPQSRRREAAPSPSTAVAGNRLMATPGRAQEEREESEPDQPTFPRVGTIQFKYPVQPPLDPNDPGWLEEMMGQLRRERRIVEACIEDAQMAFSQVSRELQLVRAELREEKRGTDDLMRFIGEIAGPEFMAMLWQKIDDGEGELSEESELEDEEEDIASSSSSVQSHHSPRAGKRARDLDSDDEDDNEGPHIRGDYKRRRLEIKEKLKETPLMPYQPTEEEMGGTDGPVYLYAAEAQPRLEEPQIPPVQGINPIPASADAASQAGREASPLEYIDPEEAPPAYETLEGTRPSPSVNRLVDRSTSADPSAEIPQGYAPPVPADPPALPLSPNVVGGQSLFGGPTAQQPFNVGEVGFVLNPEDWAMAQPEGEPAETADNELEESIVVEMISGLDAEQNALDGDDEREVLNEGNVDAEHNSDHSEHDADNGDDAEIEQHADNEHESNEDHDGGEYRSSDPGTSSESEEEVYEPWTTQPLRRQFEHVVRNADGSFTIDRGMTRHQRNMMLEEIEHQQRMAAVALAREARERASQTRSSPSSRHFSPVSGPLS